MTIIIYMSYKLGYIIWKKIFTDNGVWEQFRSEEKGKERVNDIIL